MPSSAIRLPSIHEMFPEHLLRLTSSKTLTLTPSKASTFGIQIAQPSPRASSEYPNTQISPSELTAHVRTIRPRQKAKPYESAPPRRDISPSSGTEDDESEGPKKHACNMCSKRFNRPSSLRIHLYTHTGATPFCCPWPNCGREFNVNSNMRRHYRNHAAPIYHSDVSESRDSSHRRPNPSLHAQPVYLYPVPQYNPRSQFTPTTSTPNRTLSSPTSADSDDEDLSRSPFTSRPLGTSADFILDGGHDAWRHHSQQHPTYSSPRCSCSVSPRRHPYPSTRGSPK